MEQKILKKLIAMLIIFVFMFTNFGFTISAIATSDGFQLITNGFFQKDEIAFSAYFEENDKETDESIANVNDTVKLKLKITPLIDGYLKTGKIVATPTNGGNVNFKIKNIQTITSNVDESRADFDKLNNLDVKEKEETKQEVSNEEKNEDIKDSSVTNSISTDTADESLDSSNSDISKVSDNIGDNLQITTNSTTNNEVKTENTLENNVDIITNTTIRNDTTNNVTENNTQQNETVDETNTVTNEVAIDNTLSNETTAEENTVKNETTVENPENDIPQEPSTEQQEDDEFIDEDKVIEEKSQEQENDSMEKNHLVSDVKIMSDNELAVENIIKETYIVLDIEYLQDEYLNVEDLYKEIHLQLTGTYVNSDLEEVAISKESVVNVGWTYTKDIEISSEYTKVSPFNIAEKTGTIIENKIVVKRDVTEEKYLPLKETKIEVTIPKFNGKLPIDVDVYASKLMATKKEDIGLVNFGNDNWKLDKENGKLYISVTNEQDGKSINTFGDDEYVIIYRFEDYTEDISSKLSRNVTVTAEEYDAKENNILTKKIEENQEVQVNVGELVTYDINTTEEKINKAKIYANYNSEELKYETEYTSNVTVNILTSDLFESLKINCENEYYKDSNGFEFKAEGIIYKKVKFNYSDIKNILSKGGSIEVQNLNGEVLYVLTDELINSESDCEILLNNENGINVVVKNIQANGSINFETTKAIQKCNFEKAAFKNFVSIDSKISAEVKYADIDQILALDPVSTSKEFEESYTRANLYINKDKLNTIQENENVELKIELNNDKENSDLYVNPSFELVFPKYIKEVFVESINVLYDAGLRVSDFQTYTESDIVKMRIELSGTQTMFSESTITNGTNILVNVKIKVDEYTPSKEDQIKLYYCNEGVSNYESQTKWSIGKAIPNGILKSTNGFDVALFGYQAPSGLVAINGITNYDGNLSEVKSVKQGAITKQLPINSPSRISTMELLTLNNTGNVCSDVVMLGRIPFKGNKDVISNEDLKTTTTALMKDFIKEDIQNSNMVTIYYSTKENTNKSLSDGSNEWRTAENVTDISQVRSFLIVVKGEVTPGSVLRFTYDFEIPENLPYEVNMAGSFGAYYNNNSDVAVIYESSRADLVGLTTESGPKLDATMSVDIGDGNVAKGGKRLEYKVKVTNPGSIVAENVTVNASIPSYTTYTIRGSAQYGDYGYKKADQSSELQENLGTLNPGETKEYTYVVTASNPPSLDSYADGKDENGYYILKAEDNVVNDEDNVQDDVNDSTEETPAEDEEVPVEEEKKFVKEYITKVPDIYITNKAKITTSMLATEMETNEVKNKLEQSNFISELSLDYDRPINKNMETNFMLNLLNTSYKDLKNVVAVFNITDVYSYVSGQIDQNELNSNITYDSSANKVYFNIGDMAAGDSAHIETKLLVNQLDVGSKIANCYFEFSADGIETENSTIIPQIWSKSLLQAEDNSLDYKTEIKETETVTFSTKIKNIGAMFSTEAFLDFEMTDNLALDSITSSQGALTVEKINDNKYSAFLPTINSDEAITVDVVLRARNMPGTENSKGILKRTVRNEDQSDIEIEQVYVNIINSEKTEAEKDAEEAAKRENENQNNSNTDETPSNDQNNTNSNGNNNNSNSSNDGNQNVNNSNNNNNANSTNNSNNTNNTKNDSNTTTNNSQETNQTQENINEETNKYSISGVAWLDENNNGERNDDEKLLNDINVYLLSSKNIMIKSTVTSSKGEYEFTNIEPGKYYIAVSYDNKIYTITTYNKANVSEDRNSDVIESTDENINAISNQIDVVGQDVSHIDIGLVKRDKFDLKISKYISNIKLTTKKKETVTEYDNADLAKVEIKSKYINNSKLDMEYNIVVENVGNIAGAVEKLVDYLPDDTNFDQEENKDWYIGNDGYIYANNLKETILQPGQKLELKLKLSKDITEDNMGTISNKAQIMETFSNFTSLEDTSNNSSVQNILVLVSTGKTLQTIIFLVIATFIVTVIYAQIGPKEWNIVKEKVYKNNIKIKNHIKKMYK